MKIRILFIALLFSAFSWGQTSIAAFGTNYTQDFNGLASTGTGNAWTNNTTLTGWYARTSGGSGTTISAYDTSTGTSTAAALYSFGVAGTNLVTERALGYLNTNAFTGGSGTGKAFIGWRLRNTTGSAISSITVTWTGEQWRRVSGAGSSTLQLFYQTGTTMTDLITGTWTAAPSTFTAPSTGSTIAVDGNATTYRTPGISATIVVAIAAGDEIMLRWEDLNDVGVDHCLAIDDVTVTANGLFTAVANGDWNTAATWDRNSVPPASANVLIPSPYTVYLNGTASTTTRNAGTTTTVDVGGTLSTANVGVTNTNSYVNNGTTTINGTFRLEGNSSASGNNFVYGATTGTLNFSNTAAKIVINTDVFWPAAAGSRPYNVNVLNGGINMSSGGTAAPRTVDGTFSTASRGATAGVTTVAASVLTLNGTIRIDPNGAFATAASTPIYGSSSTLVYNTGTVTNRGFEWNATGAGLIGTTPGYPNNVQIIYNTVTASYTGINLFSGTISRALNGNLTTDVGCGLTMTNTATTSDLIVGGSVINNGSLTLTPAGTTGGHLRIGGNFTNGTNGSFTGYTRSVYFTNTSPIIQTISNANPTGLTFPYVLTNGAATQVQLLNDLTISSPNASVNGGVALTLAGTATFDLNGRTLTIGTAAVANTIAGTGTIKGSTTSNLTLLGTGSVGTLNFTTGFQNLGTLTINRIASTVGCLMGTPLTINTNLVLTNGHIDLGATTMTLANGVNPTGSANSHVIADVSAGGILNKVVTSTGISYIFPIGSGAAEYSPATVNYLLGTFVTATLGMAVENPFTGHPNWSSASSYIRRYWSLTSSGVSTPTYNFSATYPASDVVGTITADFKSNQWDGTDWTNGGITITSGTISKTACTLNTGTNHISAAIRDQEIEVKSGVSGITIPNGTTTTAAFGNAAFNSQPLLSNTTHTFSIHNRGGVGLNLTNTPRVEILDGNPAGTSGDFTVTTQPSAATVAAESSLTFQITFTPTYAGYRSATVRIINTDADEGSYAFIIDGYGQCAVTSANTITPDSGPVGTEVTITATAGTLTSATAAFNGIAAAVTPIDATHIIATVPPGAISGTLLTTTPQGCQASNVFTVIDNATSSCAGAVTVPELFISEVTDATYGGLTYIEIYNGTSAPKNLANYTLRFYANGNASTYGTFTPSGTLNVGQTVVISTPTAGFSCPGTAGSGAFPGVQASGVAGINFADGSGVESLGHDHIALYNNVSATNVDVWGVYGNQSWATGLNLGDRGATFRRKNTATLPSTTYNNADWNISNWLGTGAGSCTTNDYSDIGTFNFIAGPPPTVTTLTYTPTCKATTLTVTGGQGVPGGVGIIFRWYAVQNGSTVWNLIADGGIYSGASTNTLAISDISTLLNYQFYCEVWENTNTCYKASNAIKITPSSGTTWQVGDTWSNFPPDINKAVIIDNNYDTANAITPSFDACSLTINNGKTVTIRANDYANIKNDLTVNAGGILNVDNNGSLVMVEDNGVVTNNGTTNIKRTSTPYERFDYIYWSSPVATANANIASTFAGWRTDYSFEFNTANFYDSRTINSSGTVTAVTADSFDDVAPFAWQNYSGNMTRGKGYAIMAPTGVAFSPSAPGVPVTFSGSVNNGIIPLALVQTANTDAGFVGVNNPNDDYNLVGNPYPSALFADKFIIDNGTNTSGTLYFWTHVLNISNTNPGPNVQNFISDDYALYNMTGGTRASLTTPASAIPTGFIGSGQGFFVEAQSSNNLIFNNSMRSKTYANTQFFKTVVDGIEQKDRLWLNLVNADGMFGQQLIGYFDETTLGFDWAYDGRVNLSNNYVSFYSLAGDEKYKIQARPTFDISDIVPLGYFSAVTGEFTIDIDRKEGVFNLEDTPIYLEDKVMDIIHNLKESSYTFTTSHGRFEDRFVLRYTNSALGNPDFETLDSSVSVATNHGEMIIKSHIENIQDVIVYDLLGRQLFESKNIANNSFSAAHISNSQQALIVKIKLANGFTVTRKIII